MIELDALKCPVCGSKFITTALGEPATPSFEQTTWSPFPKEPEACIKVERLKKPAELRPSFACTCQNCAYSARVKDFS